MKILNKNSMVTLLSHPIILFDSECNLCNRFIQFVIRRDKKDTFRLGDLQSEKGQELLKGVLSEDFDLTTVVLLIADKIYIESDAVVKILRNLGGVWNLLRLFVVVPKPIRDCLYRIVSRSRYRIFGKRLSCMVYTPELLNKFIT